MAYENPLAYVLGLEGLALIRSFTGTYDRAYVDARLDEIRSLVGGAEYARLADGIDVESLSPVDGYRVWSETYDGPNTAFDADTPLICEILDGLPPGPALDAACGTGRMAALLADRGHRVTGVDGSADMLARAQERVPEGEFRLGELTRLPLADDAVDVVVCALALSHLPDLRPVFAEFARVLRPGGHLVTSDLHAEAVMRGSLPRLRLPDGTPGRIASYAHPTGDYLRAALAVGLQVRRCEEPPAAPPPAPRAEGEPDGRGGPEVRAGVPTPRPADPGPWEVWPWSLGDLVPEAARVANSGIPVEIIWHFQLS